MKRYRHLLQTLRWLDRNYFLLVAIYGFGVTLGALSARDWESLLRVGALSGMCFLVWRLDNKIRYLKEQLDYYKFRNKALEMRNAALIDIMSFRKGML